MSSASRGTGDSAPSSASLFRRRVAWRLVPLPNRQSRPPVAPPCRRLDRRRASCRPLRSSQAFLRRSPPCPLPALRFLSSRGCRRFPRNRRTHPRSLRRERARPPVCRSNRVSLRGRRSHSRSLLPRSLQPAQRPPVSPRPDRPRNRLRRSRLRGVPTRRRSPLRETRVRSSRLRRNSGSGSTPARMRRGRGPGSARARLSWRSLPIRSRRAPRRGGSCGPSSPGGRASRRSAVGSSDRSTRSSRIRCGQATRPSPPPSRWRSSGISR